LEEIGEMSLLSPQSYTQLIESATALSPNVRFASVINTDGEILDGGYVNGVNPLYSQEEINKKMVMVALRNDSRYRDHPIVGMPQCSFAEYEKIKRFLINLPDNTLLVVSTEISQNTFEFLENLKKVAYDFFN
jgi:hypothetical protein